LKKKGNTSVVSFSLDLETLIFLDEFREERGGLTRSVAIRHFISLGRTYSKIIEEQLADLKTKENVFKEKEAAAGVKDAKK
jgi:hypothetical protein